MAAGVKLFGVWWDTYTAEEMVDGSVWHLMTFASGGIHIPGTGFRLGRIHHAHYAKGIFRTDCGRRLRCSGAFVRYFSDQELADQRVRGSLCKHCFRGM